MNNPWGDLTALEFGPYRGSTPLGEGRLVIEPHHSNTIGSHLTDNGDYNNIVGTNCVVTGSYNTVIGSDITLEGNYNYVIAHNMNLKGDGMHITYPILLKAGKDTLNKYFPPEITNIIQGFAWHLDKGNKNKG